MTAAASVTSIPLALILILRILRDDIIYCKKRELLLRLIDDDGNDVDDTLAQKTMEPGDHHYQLITWDLSHSTSLEHVPDDVI